MGPPVRCAPDTHRLRPYGHHAISVGVGALISVVNLASLIGSQERFGNIFFRPHLLNAFQLPNPSKPCRPWDMRSRRTSRACMSKGRFVQDNAEDCIRSAASRAMTRKAVSALQVLWWLIRIGCRIPHSMRRFLGQRNLGHPAYPRPKGTGDHSMPEKRGQARSASRTPRKTRVAWSRLLIVSVRVLDALSSYPFVESRFGPMNLGYWLYHGPIWCNYNMPDKLGRRVEPLTVGLL